MNSTRSQGTWIARIDVYHALGFVGMQYLGSQEVSVSLGSPGPSARSVNIDYVSEPYIVDELIGTTL